MKICFLHPGQMQFNVETPFLQPLGGTESALAYLAIELAGLGHEITLLSNTTQTGTLRGVSCLNYTDQLGTDYLQNQVFDAVVVINATRMGPQFKSCLKEGTPLILWATLDVDQPPLHPLLQKEVRQAWDGIAAVSEYHRLRLVNHLHVDMERVYVLRNAMAPVFENQFKDGADLAQAKRATGAPRLAYTSTPFRGLESLMDLYPRFSQLFPAAVLKVFSSMQVYQKGGNDEEKWLLDLYEKCRNMAGVDYVGSIPQPLLAQELRSTSILAYPSTFSETSSIAVMEAMASGCLVVTSEFGALPETTRRYSQLVPVAFRSIDDFEKEYFNALVAVFMEFYSHPEAMYDHLWEQVCFANQEYTWRQRAHDWVAVLEKMH